MLGARIQDQATIKRLEAELVQHAADCQEALVSCRNETMQARAELAASRQQGYAECKAARDLPFAHANAMKMKRLQEQPGCRPMVVDRVCGPLKAHEQLYIDDSLDATERCKYGIQHTTEAFNAL